MGGQLRRGHHCFGTGAGRDRIPYAHPVQQICEPSGTDDDVPGSGGHYPAEMLDIPKPKLKGGKYIIVEAEASEYVKGLMEEMVARAEAIRDGVVDPRDDNMLKITGKQDFWDRSPVAGYPCACRPGLKAQPGSAKYLPGIFRIRRQERDADRLFRYRDAGTGESIYRL